MAFTYTGEMVELGFGRGWLNRPAASSIFRIDARLGHAMQITEAGRTRNQQMAHWLTYQRNGSPIALHPDTPSLHQVGNAVDSNEAQRIIAILEDHGWRRTVYRWVNGVWTLVEPWHFEYFEHLDNHRHEGVPSGMESVMSNGADILTAVQWVNKRQDEINVRAEERHREIVGYLKQDAARREDINARREECHRETLTAIATLAATVAASPVGGALSAAAIKQISDAATAASTAATANVVDAAHQAEMAKLEQIQAEQVADRDREIARLRAQLEAAG